MTPERDTLYARLQSVQAKIDGVYMRIEGLHMTPGRLREDKFNGLVAELKKHQAEEADIRKELQALPFPDAR